MSCQVDPTSSTISIVPVQGVYLSNLLIAIETKGLAIRNPCVNFLGATNSQWSAYFLSFENSTAVSTSLANAYMVINNLNMVSTAMGFIYETAANVTTYYYTYDWF